MKFLPILISLLWFSINMSLAQTIYNSIDEYSGLWSSPSTWVGGTAPSNIITGGTININGYVTINNSLSFSGGGTLNINEGDTLYVTGDLDATGSSEINIKGTLIVKGNLKLAGSTDVSNTSTVIVIGDVIKSSGGSDLSNYGNFYVAGTYNSNDFSPVGNLGDETLLYQNNPILFNFINEITNGALPIELIDFKAQTRNGSFCLTFSTLSEQNFDYFAIERSSDAKNYLQIGTVKGSGWSQTRKDYSFADKNPLPGLNYYRLKAVDFDGYTEYFPAIAVFNDQTKVTVGNVVNDKTLKINSNISAQVKLVNLTGQQVFLGEITNGQNNISLPYSLPRGYYSLLIHSDKHVVKKEKVIVK
jgi:hypothetical protein